MRILYFYQYFTSPKGSWGTRVYEFARRWAEQGDSITVITSVYDKSDLKPTGLFSSHLVDGINVKVINVKLSNKHGFFMRMLTFLAYAGLSSFYAVFSKAEIVISSSGPITVGIPGLICRWLRRKPFVFEVRDIWPEGAIQLGILRNSWMIAMARWFEKTCYQNASQVIALSKGMAEWIKEKHEIQHVTVIPNACDNHLAQKTPPIKIVPEWARNKRLILYTGTLGLMDDCLQLVNLARELTKRGEDSFEIVVIGDGKENTFLKQQASNLSNIHFLGLMPKEDVFAWLKIGFCAVVIFKPVEILNTVSPNKMFDAFACGLPVVQTTNGWIQGLIENEECGLNAQHNGSGLADMVILLGQDPALHKHMSEQALRVARDLFDRGKLANQMKRVLSDSL